MGLDNVDVVHEWLAYALRRSLAAYLSRVVHAVFLVVEILIDADEIKNAPFAPSPRPCVRQRRAVALTKMRASPRRPKLTVIVNE